MDNKQLEKYSSAISLSDMEIFVFPELMYSLVLANLMSPVVWQWRENSTFSKMMGKSPYRRLTRLRQFIMDEYEFNLDLNTWGLTQQHIEMERFREFISPEKIAESNALFGYQGDEYYFDIGIRRHFGLDQYGKDVIPYWKTETAEAMNAFRFKENYTTGAGECVSLSALYAAAAFVVCDIPLEDIFMILTPLHSQNFIDIQDGVITNNRRILTKSMWFNGTEITYKAQRAIRNENVTVVAHCTGYNHCLYDQATIDPAQYDRVARSLTEFLTTGVDITILANFLRSFRDYQEHFAFCCTRRGQKRFLKAETLFKYEHSSQFRIANGTFEKLLDELSDEDFLLYRPENRLCVDMFLKFFRKTKIDLANEADCERLTQELASHDARLDRDFVDDLREFTRIIPKLPTAEKAYAPSMPICIEPGQSREEIIDYLQSIRTVNPTVDLAFYALRDMSGCDWLPFVKAGIERCPVSLEAAGGMSIKEAYNWLLGMDNNSIYDDKRLAHPDEVVNYHRGDGLEKAFVLANIIHNRDPHKTITIEIDREIVTVKADEEYDFMSDKSLDGTVVIDQSFTTPDLAAVTGLSSQNLSADFE